MQPLIRRSIHLLPAGGAFVEFEGGDNVGFAFEVSGEVAADFLDLVAAAGWTGGDFHFSARLRSGGSFGGDEEVVGFDTSLLN